MTDPALWRREAVTEGEDTVSLAVCGNAPSTTRLRRAVPLPAEAREELWFHADVPPKTDTARFVGRLLLTSRAEWTGA